MGRDRIIGFQENYPGLWGDLTVLRVVSAHGDRTAVAEIEIVSPAEVIRCAAFWQKHEEQLHRGVEYWVTVGGEQPPPR